MKLPPKSGSTLAEYIEEWLRDVAVNLKGSTVGRRNRICGRTLFQNLAVCI
jgi:hypothetical protein